MSAPGDWAALERTGPPTATVDGVELRRGSRVVLRPRAGADLFDLALTGRVAVVDSFEEDLDGGMRVTVTVEDDPGQHLGEYGQPGHRFFFDLAEVEPMADVAPAAEPRTRILVAGIGNVFLGDDGFGVELAARLAGRALPAGVTVKDYGIRGMDLAYAMQEGWDVVVFLDAVPRGEAPGTLYVIEPEIDPDAVALDTHGMDPVRVLHMARALGDTPGRTLVVGCEPLVRMTGDEEELVGELSEPVTAALGGAVALVERLLGDLTDGEEQ